MARQRVVFISGLGSLVPGQVSSLSDAKNYVKGAGSVFSGNPATKISSGSLINPAVGIASQLLAKSGALSAGLGTLGVPQNIQNLVSSSVNTGGLYIELFLNPQRITEEKGKLITKVPTGAGFANLHWGLDLTGLKFEIITRNLRPGASHIRAQNAKNAQQNLDQLKKFFEVNNFNTGLIYQNKIYVGHFEGKFISVRVADNPNIISSNFSFIIDKLPQITLPGLGSFNVNTIPFSI